MKMMTDPRRIVVTFHSNSRSPRARKWYRVMQACKFDDDLFPHRDFVEPWDATRNPNNRQDAIRRAKAMSAETGFPYVPGLWQGVNGYPMKRIDQ